MSCELYSEERSDMVQCQIEGRGIQDQDVLHAFREVPRHLFVPYSLIGSAYDDKPLAIGCEQTISQPYMAALMTSELRLKPGMKVLEVGTGSGYQAAILYNLGAKVYTIERHSDLAKSAEKVFRDLDYEIIVLTGDGTFGLNEYAPFDRIIITAASNSIPKELIRQLVVGGVMVMPLGESFRQDLTIIRRVTETDIEQTKVCACVFVPLLGEGL